MRKSTSVALLVGGALTVALLLARTCSKSNDAHVNSGDSVDKRDGADRSSGSDGVRRSGSADVMGSATAPARAGDVRKGSVVFFSPWGGSTLDQLGRERPQEGNPMGPMSLAVDGKGRVYVLDEVNGRIVRRGADGKVEAAAPIDLKTPQDLVVADDGSMAVLDRFAGKEVAIYDESGTLRGELPLGGEGIDDTGAVTGVFADGKDIYVEREHGTLVKIGNTSGVPAEPRTEIPGRPSRDGLSFLNAGITEAEVGRVWVSSIVRATGEHRFTRELRLKTFVASIVLLDSDKTGQIYFAVLLEPEGQPPSVLLECMEPLKGIVVGTATLPANTLPEETFKDLTVLDEGGVIYALRSEQGVTYQAYDCY
jgi:hypothetical protein